MNPEINPDRIESAYQRITQLKKQMTSSSPERHIG